jgi:hypothetical protein
MQRRDILRLTCLPSRSPQWRAKAGDPGLIRTADKQFRKLLLYPSELRGHVLNFTRDVAVPKMVAAFAAVSGNCWSMLDPSCGRAI